MRSVKDELIIKRGVKQSFLASKLGITESSLSRKLSDQRAFTPAEIFQIMDIFKLSVEEAKEFFL